MIRGKLAFNEPMSRHATLRAGGCADVYYCPVDIADLQEFISKETEGKEIYWIGYGSNLLVRDGGYPGIVISLSGTLDGIKLVGSNRIRVEAGAASAHVARFSADHGLCGTEFLAGIPGTIGGALAMNAGSNETEIWDIVTSVEMIDRTGSLIKRDRAEFEVSYRHVKRSSCEWFVSAELQLKECSKEVCRKKIEDLLKQRKKSQPTNKPSCGSVFKNPENDFAARLIESAGLKGFCVEGACVSDKHANFIINTRGATAQDIETLIEKIKTEVKDKFNVLLEPEVQIIGTRLPR